MTYDTVVFEKAWGGTWQIAETVRSSYVISEPAACHSDSALRASIIAMPSGEASDASTSFAAA